MEAEIGGVVGAGKSEIRDGAARVRNGQRVVGVAQGGDGRADEMKDIAHLGAGDGRGEGAGLVELHGAGAVGEGDRRGRVDAVAQLEQAVIAELEGLVDDALDVIEFAAGDIDERGSKRT